MNNALIVTDVPEFISLFENHSYQVISPHQYLQEEAWRQAPPRHVVFNLSSSYRYQSIGYYISLLADARGQQVYPSTAAILDVSARRIFQSISEELEEQFQEELSGLAESEFALSVYFGKNLDEQYNRLASKLFELFPVPLFRVYFKKEDGEWRIAEIDILGAKDLTPEHREEMLVFAAEFFAQRKQPERRISNPTFDMAILVDHAEKDPPSNSEALENFARAFRKRRALVEFIEREDYQRVPEFDGLFIRTTTSVNHYTYRFARLAQTEGLAVVDDPISILRCANKVYLAELLSKRGVRTPATQLLFKSNYRALATKLDFPVVLKQPDSAWSLGVSKAESREEYLEKARLLFKKSDLIIAQEFMRTDFDWRIGVLGGEPFYACKYFMAKEHWQIYDWEKTGQNWGEMEAVPLAKVPQEVLAAALKASRLIGTGLYGVDVKHTPQGVFVIEVNDNPSIDAGYEDTLLGEVMYDRVAEYFQEKIQRLQLTQRVLI